MLSKDSRFSTNFHFSVSQFQSYNNLLLREEFFSSVNQQTKKRHHYCQTTCPRCLILSFGSLFKGYQFSLSRLIGKQIVISDNMWFKILFSRWNVNNLFARFGRRLNSTLTFTHENSGRYWICLGNWSELLVHNNIFVDNTFVQLVCKNRLFLQFGAKYIYWTSPPPSQYTLLILINFQFVFLKTIVEL